MDNYILLASERKGISNEDGTEYPLFSKLTQPAFFPALVSIEDIILKPGGSFNLSQKDNASLLIIPLVGGIETIGNKKATSFIDAGEWGCYSGTGKTIQFANPFEQEVNALVIQFVQNSPGAIEKIEKGLLNLNHSPGTLPLNTSLKISLGQFSERETKNYLLTQPGLIAYVIDGTFEVHDRLLESRDGLSLPYAESVAFECFKADGILLVIHE